MLGLPRDNGRLQATSESETVVVFSSRIGHLRWRRIFTFSPLRRVTFCQTRQKVTKKRCAPIIRPLRCAPGFPHSGLAPGRTALQAPSWGPALDGHPCPSPPSACPPLGLLKSRRSRSRSKPDQQPCGGEEVGQRHLCQMGDQRLSGNRFHQRVRPAHARR